MAKGFIIAISYSSQIVVNVKRNRNAYLPSKLYKRVLESMPIPDIDAVVKTEKGVVLGVRTHEPVKNKPWLIGGRVLFGERLEHAAVRKVREELGLRVKVERFVGVYATRFTKGEIRHSINLVFVVRKTGGKLQPNKEYSRLLFLTHMRKGLHPYVRKVLQDSGVFGISKKGVSKRLPYFVD